MIVWPAVPYVLEDFACKLATRPCHDHPGFEPCGIDRISRISSIANCARHIRLKYVKYVKSIESPGRTRRSRGCGHNSTPRQLQVRMAPDRSPQESNIPLPTMASDDTYRSYQIITDHINKKTKKKKNL